MTSAAVQQAIQRIVAAMPPRVRRVLSGRVKFHVFDRPRAADLERGRDQGLTARSPGYFYGRPLVADAAEEDEILETEDGELAQPAHDPPGGVIYAFAANLTPDTIEDFVWHEVAHFFGEDEDSLGELGLADSDAETGEVIEVDDDEA